MNDEGVAMCSQESENPHLGEKNQGIEHDRVEEPAEFKPTWKLSCIFAVLCLLSFLTALDGTVITTSLPTITGQMKTHNDQLYIWIAQCFILSSTAPQPLYGQLANIFGRRNPFLIAIALFALGSGIAGGASDTAMLVTGRTVQGLGAAGLYVLSDIIICDLVPPRNRGPYLSAVLSTAGIGSTIGPVIGGAIAEHNWRWIFYLNIPISALGFVIVVFLLKVNWNRSPTWAHALASVDFLGASIFIPSMISLLYGLITGGTQHPWSSWKVLLSMILGISGWILYHFQQATPSLCRHPSTPPHLFTNRTSATGYALIFFSSIVLYRISFFLPFYFQGVKLVSPMLSGVYYLPFALAIIPFAGIAGWALSNWGKYVPLHFAGFALLAIGTGLYATLNSGSSMGAWIGFQIIPSAGIALIYTSTMPSTLAALKEEDVATATATYSFVRSFGLLWGITIAGIVFNGQVNAHLDLIGDESLREVLEDGAAYSFAAREGGLGGLHNQQRLREIVSVYVRALRVLWLVAMAIALIGFICVPIERSLPLEKTHKTDFGMKEEKKEGPKEETVQSNRRT